MKLMSWIWVPLIYYYYKTSLSLSFSILGFFFFKFLTNMQASKQCEEPVVNTVMFAQCVYQLYSKQSNQHKKTFTVVLMKGKAKRVLHSLDSLHNCGHTPWPHSLATLASLLCHTHYCFPFWYQINYHHRLRSNNLGGWITWLLIWDSLLSIFAYHLMTCSFSAGAQMGYKMMMMMMMMLTEE